MGSLALLNDADSGIQAFLNECLRFSPPVSLLFPRVVPPKGDTIDGKFVPGGTSIGTDFWSMGRRVDIFGEDADVFRPERFLEAPPEKKSTMEKTADMMFGSGRYMCVGKTLAWMEMNKLFVEVSTAGFSFIRCLPYSSCSGTTTFRWPILNILILVLIARCLSSGI